MGTDTDTSTKTRARIRIGLEMPRWLPPRYHAAGRVLLGLVLGGLFALYGVLLALTLDGILRGGPWAYTQGTMRLAALWLVGLLIRRWALRRAARRG